jgi:hypothetical protein
VSCERIAEKSAETRERFVLMGTRSDKTAARPDQTCANIARIGEKGLRSRSFAQTVVKSGPIDAKCVGTGMNGGRIDAICAETFATTGETGAMPVGTSPQSEEKRGQRGKRGKGKWVKVN